MTTAIGRLLDASGKPDWQVGAEVGIHPSVISRYRSGERRPHARHIKRLCDYLRVDEKQLLGTAEEFELDGQILRMEHVGDPSLLPKRSADDPTAWID